MTTSRFKIIDEKLKEAAKKLNVKVSTDVGGYTVDGVSVPREKIEIRKIIWIDGPIGKGIVIEPHFESGNIDSPSWNFSALAWLDKKPVNSGAIPFWEKILMEKVSLASIEKNIDLLINESLENLKAIKREDLTVN